MKRYILKSKNLEVSILEVGATIEWIKRTEDGLNLIHTLPEKDYEGNNFEGHGAVVGPSAGRIWKRDITLNGETTTIKVDLPLLHSGQDRICHKKWNLKHASDNEVTLTYHYESKDFAFLSGQDIEVTYKLNDNKLTYIIHSRSKQPKIMNYTNHTYFSLGAQDSRDLELKCNLISEIENAEGNFITGKLIHIRNTNWDFTKFKTVDIIDNPFVFEGPIYLRNPKNGVLLKVTTNQPSVVFYNDAYSGQERKFKGFAIENQGYVDAISHDNFPSNIKTENINETTWEFTW